MYSRDVAVMHIESQDSQAILDALRAELGVSVSATNNTPQPAML